MRGVTPANWPPCVDLHRPQTEANNDHIATTWYNDLTPDHKAIPVDELPKGYLSGAKLTILSLAPQVYLPWLFGQLQAKGVNIVRRKVESLEEAAETVNGKVDLVVNATGLGASYCCAAAGLRHSVG